MAPFPRSGSNGRRRLAAALTMGAVAVGLMVGGLGLSAASAAEVTGSAATAAATTGWVRLAHLSPDTKAVDIRLSALSGGSIVKSLSDIGYGAVSPYMALDPGTYVVAMAPTGGDFATPVIQASVTVVAGQPLTVAAYGKNADLQAAIYHDDLSVPSSGQARVRVVQASTIVPTVSVATSTGTSIANNVAQGSATDYASVGSGSWTLDLTGGTVSSQAAVQLDAGSVSTLFVLDDASGGLALKAVLDSASAGDLPAGGIQTGGGGTATQHTATQHTAGLAAAVPPVAAQPVAVQPVAGQPAADVPAAAVATDVPTGRLLIDMVTGALCLVAGAVGVFLHRRRTRPSPSTSVDLRVASRLARGERDADADADANRADAEPWRGADRADTERADAEPWRGADRADTERADAEPWQDAERADAEHADAEPWRAAEYSTLRTRQWR